ncbi:MAG: gliding motility protein GldN [Sphingobacteriales bacterium]|nr:MAG: gliding motility protein GldN [Sphingobacteriales bacterium]
MNVKNIVKSAAIALMGFSATVSYGQNPIITDNAQVQNPNSGDAVTNTWKPSLVRDGVIDRVPHVMRVIPWSPIRENDVLWKKRVWREIDTREKQNLAFRYPGDENTGGGYFIEILMDAVKRGKIKAYSAYDERFTSALSKDQIIEMMVGKTDTIEVVDPVTGAVSQSYQNRDFNPELITKYRLKEDWIIDRNTGRMVVRIIGIAPVRDVYDQNTGLFRGTQPMFWLYYPEIRETLAQYEVYNPENDVARMNWDEYFEGRWFASRITRVSNGFNEAISENASGMEALYQAQRFSEEIFNKEHDMWVY